MLPGRRARRIDRRRLPDHQRRLLSAAARRAPRYRSWPSPRTTARDAHRRTSATRRRRPARQIAERQMDHHRRRAGPQSWRAVAPPSELAKPDRRTGPAGECWRSRRASPRCVRRLRARRLWRRRPSSATLCAPACPAALRRRPRQSPDHRGDDRVGPALPERHAEALVRHRFQIGKQRAAGAVRREIEMHAPGGHHRLELGVLEILVEPLPRRGDKETRRVGDPRRSARAPRRKERAQRLPGTASARRAARRYAARPAPNAATMARQRCASAGLNAAIRFAVASRLLSTPSQVPSGNAVAKHCSAPTKARPCASKRSLWAAKNGEPANRLRFIA